MIKLEEANKLEQEAKRNDGVCSHCHQTISIYRYKLNREHGLLLKRLATHVRTSGVNKVNFDDIEGTYSQKTQRTKLRLHGLIAKYKEDGKQVRNTWLITTKGGQFLKGVEIPETVVIYNNQVIGHEGGLITLARTLNIPVEDYEAEAITEPEARTYADIRKPKGGLSYLAEYVGRTYSETGLQTGQSYNLTIKRLQLGKPVEITGTLPDGKAFKNIYPDVSSFKKSWRIT